MSLTETLQLDGTKVAWYPDRVAAWERGERIAPVTIDWALTRQCNYACEFCIQEDQLISMANGSVKAIKHINVGDDVLSVSRHRLIVSSRVTAAWLTKKNAHTLQLHMQSGSLICTGNHRILTSRGWIPAYDVQVGESVAFQKNAGTQSDEESSNCRKSSGGLAGVGLCEEDESPAQGSMDCREDAHSAVDINERTSGPFSQNAVNQSNETARSHRKIHEVGVAGEETFGIQYDETELETWQDRTENTWLLSEQIGEETRYYLNTSRVSVRRRWEVLDCQDDQWDSEKSRFHLQARTSSISSQRRVLPQKQGSLFSGNGGLQSGGLDCIGILDQESSLELAPATHPQDDVVLVGWETILAITTGPDSAVYDFECHPHHNFIASGVVVHNCYAMLQENRRQEQTPSVAFAFLEDCAAIGVKGVSLISDGESTVHPAFAEVIQYGHALGLAMGLGSNGLLLKQPVLERILPCLTYLRFNFSAGTRERYADIMGVKPEWYDQVIENITDAMAIKRRDGLPVTINMQMVTMPQYADQILPLTRLAKEIRPDYLIFKHCADDIQGQLGVDYTKYADCVPLFHEAEAMSEDGFRIVVKWSRLDGQRTYTRCYGPPFIMQVSGSGLVAPCGFLFNERYKAFHIGNICEQRFRDIWASDRYWEVMGYLASEQFNPQVRCGPNCLQHNTNTALFDLRHRGTPLPMVGETPAHVGFL